MCYTESENLNPKGIRMKTTKEKVSYCIGLQTGMNLKQQFSDIDMDCLNSGMSDALINDTLQLPNEEIQSILTSLRQQIETQQRHFATRMAEENKKASAAFLAQNKTKDNIITLASGLQYRVLEAGHAESASPTPFDVVKVHYRGTFMDGRVFDSSYQRGKPAILPMNRTIAGWSEALQMMQVGAKWELFIPPYLAYGEAGFPPAIGPNTALIFEIELLGINETE